MDMLFLPRIPEKLPWLNESRKRRIGIASDQSNVILGPRAIALTAVIRKREWTWCGFSESRLPRLTEGFKSSAGEIWRVAGAKVETCRTEGHESTGLDCIGLQPPIRTAKSRDHRTVVLGFALIVVGFPAAVRKR